MNFEFWVCGGKDEQRRIHPDDHLQEVFLSCWSFTRGCSILLIICNRLFHPDDHLQEASHSRWSFARGWSIRMIIYKRPVHLDDHAQEAGSSGWSFALGQSIQMSISIGSLLLFIVGCLLFVGPLGWSFARGGPSKWSFVRGQFIRMMSPSPSSKS